MAEARLAKTRSAYADDPNLSGWACVVCKAPMDMKDNVFIPACKCAAGYQQVDPLGGTDARLVVDEAPRPKCPACQSSVGAPAIRNITVCGACGRSVVVVGDSIRFATATDTINLSPAEIKQLKALRPR